MMPTRPLLIDIVENTLDRVVTRHGSSARAKYPRRRTMGWRFPFAHFHGFSSSMQARPICSLPGERGDPSSSTKYIFQATSSNQSLITRSCHAAWSWKIPTTSSRNISDHKSSKGRCVLVPSKVGRSELYYYREPGSFTTNTCSFWMSQIHVGYFHGYESTVCIFD